VGRTKRRSCTLHPKKGSRMASKKTNIEAEETKGRKASLVVRKRRRISQ